METSVAGRSSSPRLADRRWPADALEYLGRCPACDSRVRRVRLDGLWDRSFHVAEGEWTLYDCAGCGAAYLDPRPDTASIGRAYARYFTHREIELGDQAYFWRRSGWKARLKTGYLNLRYGYRFPNGIALGYLALLGRRTVRLSVDYLIRHLPAPRTRDARLLDIGCGNGRFVAIANTLGYQAVGIDPDPKAIAFGRSNGLDLRQGLVPDAGFTEAGFAQVTLNHVLEHLHYPREAVEQLFATLAPGGRLWLSQPNLAALGLKRFGESWRGLETPRHLSLYDFESLSALLAAAGFTTIRLMAAEEAASFYYRQSSAMRDGLDPYDAPEPPGWDQATKQEAAAADRAARRHPELSESLTVTARRPG